MQKLYSRINWENEPSIETPLNEQNLNRMDAALDNVDNRVISQDAEKADKTELNDLVKDWVIDGESGIITVTKKSGEKLLFDLNIEKIPVDFSLSDRGIITMTTDDGTKFTANIGAMIPILTFNNSDTISVSVSGSGINKIYSFSIKNGSVTEEKLQPNFLSTIKVEAAKAESFAKQSQSYAVGTGDARPNEAADNAKTYYEKSKEIYDSLEDSGNVTGVKGSNETNYRSGKVNLTPSNIGAVSTSGDKMTGKLEAHGGISLNGSTTSANIQYILGVDAYAEGGTVHYQNANDLSVGKLGGLSSNLYFCARTTGENFTGDINTQYNNGAYWCYNAKNKPPVNQAYGLLVVQTAGTTDVVKQTYIPWISNGVIGAACERVKVSNVWSPWKVVETEGNNLVCGNLFYMTDNEGRKRMVLQAIEDGSGANNYGSQLIFGAGGNTFIGAGESASALYTTLQTESNKKVNEVYTKGGENIFISADGYLYLYANANAIANRKGICFNAAGELIPVGDSNIFLGTSAFPLGGIASRSIYLTNNSGGIIFGDESVMISENNNRLSLYAVNGVSIDSGILYFGPGTSEKIELANRMLKLSGYNGIQFNSYIRSDICPTDIGAYKLGLSNYRWKEIWCSTSLNTSSDRNLKKNIHDLSSDERYAKFFMLLQPKSYLFKDGESGRTHVGFISQDVEEAMAKCGLSSLEFAGFCKDRKIEVEEIIHPADEEAGEEEWIERKEHPVFDEDGNPVYEYSLRYEEFIALNTMMIQSLQDRISEAEDRIAKIEEKLKRKDDIYGIY